MDHKEAAFLAQDLGQRLGLPAGSDVAPLREALLSAAASRAAGRGQEAAAMDMENLGEVMNEVFSSEYYEYTKVEGAERLVAALRGEGFEIVPTERKPASMVTCDECRFSEPAGYPGAPFADGHDDRFRCIRWETGYGERSVAPDGCHVESDEGWCMELGPKFGCVLGEAK